MLADNPAGKSSREMAWRRHVMRVCLGLLGIAAALCIPRTGCSITSVSTFLAFIAGLVAIDRLLVPVMDRLKAREDHASRGAEAEESVGALLHRLPAGWVVLHDVRASFGNIDHLVLRADGALFVLETKSHHGRVSEDRGELRLNGKPFEKDFIRQTHANVFWLREFFKGRFGIEPWINAAIVFPNASVAVRRTLRGVDVVSLDFLDRWLARARGKPEVARKFQGRIEQLKSELLAKR
jgi:hypothetical protein